VTAEQLASQPQPGDALETLREGLRTFLLASSERPELVRLMNTLGISDSDRLDCVFDRYIEPSVKSLRQAIETTHPSALDRISNRELFFLGAHGAAAPFTSRGLSDRFNETDGALDPTGWSRVAAAPQSLSGEKETVRHPLRRHRDFRMRIRIRSLLHVQD
jgi:hypothetical protein